MAGDFVRTTDARRLRAVEMLQAGATDYVLKDRLERLGAAVRRALMDAALVRDGKWDGELIHTSADGRQIIVASRQALRRDEQGNPRAILEINYDITDRKQSEERLRYASTHDGLTDLYNRAYYEEEIRRLERGRQFPVGVIVADLNGLKVTNDQHGHAAGDVLLKRAARVLKNAFHAEDVVARIGGDEFAVLLPAANAAALDAACARLRQLQSADNAAYPGFALSIALGAALADRGAQLSDALKQADARMYEEKAQSKK